MFESVKYVWMNGETVPLKEANVSVLSHTLHYGLGVFEGIRCYKCVDGSAIFRLNDHLLRLLNSAKIFMMKTKYSLEDLRKATFEIISKNEFDACYIRPIIFYGLKSLGIFIDENFPIEVVIAAWPWGAYLGNEALKKGVSVKTSTFTRYHVNSVATRSKAVGNYMTSVLAKREAVMDGYDEAIFLDADGYVSEGTGENIFIVKNNKLITTPITSILNGVTRDSIIKIAIDKGIEVEERRFTRDEIYIADEAFLTGTAAEVTPIRELDHRIIGRGYIGDLTEDLQNTFFDIIKGKNDKYKNWLEYIK
jgi:branched-chain amino acid aminotransferase